LAPGSPSFPIDNSFNRFAELRTSRRGATQAQAVHPLASILGQSSIDPEPPEPGRQVGLRGCSRSGT
jgi:hypothetical protein